jgi:hypothetical protein
MIFHNHVSREGIRYRTVHYSTPSETTVGDEEEAPAAQAQGPACKFCGLTPCICARADEIQGVGSILYARDKVNP